MKAYSYLTDPYRYQPLERGTLIRAHGLRAVHGIGPADAQCGHDSGPRAQVQEGEVGHSQAEPDTVARRPARRPRGRAQASVQRDMEDIHAPVEAAKIGKVEGAKRRRSAMPNTLSSATTCAPRLRCLC